MEGRQSEIREASANAKETDVTWLYPLGIALSEILIVAIDPE
jgi:hypothetical protein